MNTSTIALFCCLYDFGCIYEAWERHHLVPSTRKRIRKTTRTRGEMMFIMTLFGTLKRDMEREATRHRSVDNAFLHILSCLVAYTPGKPGIAMKTTGIKGTGGMSILGT